MTKQLIVNCSDVSFSRNGVSILERVNLKLHSATITTIIGPNGGGKTTLGKIVAGSLRPMSGKVHRKKNASVGYMPQKISINHLMPLTSKQFILLSVSGKVDRKSFHQVVSDHNIAKLLSKQLYELSGGELQRVLFARLLVANPDIMILDEPTEGLDVVGQQEFYYNLEKLSSEQGKTILLISHDLHTVMSGSNHVLCLDRVICCSGLPETISKDKSYEKMFYNKNHKGLVSYYKHYHRD